MVEAADPGREAWLLLFQLFRTKRREVAALHSDFDLNPAQVHLILNLDPARGVPMSELAEALACDASYITGLADKVEARGLVQRQPNPDDRRVKLLRLTEKGAGIRDKLIERVSIPPRFIAALSQADKLALKDIFTRATEAAQDRTPLP